MDIGRMLPLFAVRNRAGFLKVTIQKFYRPSGSSTQMDGVRSDVVFPSLMDAMEIGEAFLDHPLPHDRIRRAPDFKPLDAQGLFIPRLKDLSQERVNACQDFSYVIQDVIKTKERLDKNVLPLNKEAREKELAESDARQKERNAERRARFEKMSKADQQSLTFFKITLEGLDKGEALKAYDPASDSGSYMRRAKDEAEDLDETPKWPTGLDPVKRESLLVLRDLVKYTDSARTAGLIK
jgi:carboxyl-terminal processing protease